MFKRAIVIFPKFEELHLIQQLRLQFDPLAERIEPHLTLVFPFESTLSAEQLQTHIRQAVQEMGPFPIRLQGITGSEGEYLFLNVKRGNDQLIELHDRLYSGVLAAYLSVEQAFLPHLTVGRLREKAAYLRALEEARKVSTAFQTVIEEVAVYQVAGKPAVEFGVRL